MLINEKIQTTYDEDGNELFYLLDDNQKRSKVYKYEDMNYKSKLEQLAKSKSISCWWVYKHGIGFYPRQEPIWDEDGNFAGYEAEEEAGLKARARYLGQESWYDEEHFFWVQLSEDEKPLLTQLRVSNHETKHNQWQKTHSEKRAIKCDTCLNIIINPSTRDAFNSDASTPYRITSIEVNYPTEDALNDLVNPNTPANVFIKKIQSGLAPTVTLDDINAIFDTEAIVVTSGGREVRDNQIKGNNPRAGATVPDDRLGIIDRSSVPELIDDTVKDWEKILAQKKAQEEQERKEAEAKRKQEVMKNVIPTVIPDSAIFDTTRPYTNPVDGREFESFEYNGRWYALEPDEEKINFFLQNDKNVAKYSTCSYIAYLITNDGYIRKKPVIPIAEESEIQQMQVGGTKNKNIKENRYMKILIKTNRGLRNLGEGRVFSKKQLKLNEFTSGKVSLTLNPNGQDVRASSVQTNAQNMLNNVPQATAVTLQADDVDGVTSPTFSSSDPRNDTVQQMDVKHATSSAVMNAAKNGGTLQITKDDSQQSMGESKKNNGKLVEMRKNQKALQFPNHHI